MLKAGSLKNRSTRERPLQELHRAALQPRHHYRVAARIGWRLSRRLNRKAGSLDLEFRSGLTRTALPFPKFPVARSLRQCWKPYPDARGAAHLRSQPAHPAEQLPARQTTPPARLVARGVCEPEFEPKFENQSSNQSSERAAHSEPLLGPSVDPVTIAARFQRPVDCPALTVINTSHGADVSGRGHDGGPRPFSDPSRRSEENGAFRFPRTQPAWSKLRSLPSRGSRPRAVGSRASSG